MTRCRERPPDPVEIWRASVSYLGFRAVKIKAEQFYEPFSLEAATSSRATTFMERGLPYAFSPARSVGVGIAATPAKGSALEAGGFTEDLGSSNNLKKAFTGHVAYAPIDTKGRLLHFGAGASYRVPEDNTLRYATAPVPSPIWRRPGLAPER